MLSQRLEVPLESVVGHFKIYMCRIIRWSPIVCDWQCFAGQEVRDHGTRLCRTLWVISRELRPSYYWNMASYWSEDAMITENWNWRLVCVRSLTRVHNDLGVRWDYMKTRVCLCNLVPEVLPPGTKYGTRLSRLLMWPQDGTGTRGMDVRVSLFLASVSFIFYFFVYIKCIMYRCKLFWRIYQSLGHLTTTQRVKNIKKQSRWFLCHTHYVV